MDENNKIVKSIIRRLERQPKMVAKASVIRLGAADGFDDIGKRELYQAVYNERSRNIHRQGIDWAIAWMVRTGIIEEIRWHRKECKYRFTDQYLSDQQLIPNDEIELPERPAIPELDG